MSHSDQGADLWALKMSQLKCPVFYSPHLRWPPPKTVSPKQHPYTSPFMKARRGAASLLLIIKAIPLSIGFMYYVFFSLINLTVSQYSSSAPWSEWDKTRGTFFPYKFCAYMFLLPVSGTALDTQTVLRREVFSPHGVWQAFCHLLFQDPWVSLLVGRECRATYIRIVQKELLS